MLVVTDLRIGGTPTVVRELALRLRTRASIHVVSLADEGPVGAEIARAGVSLSALEMRGVRDVLAVRRLAGILRDERIDTCCSFLIHASAMAAAAKWLCPRVRLIQSVQTTQPYPAWHWGLQRLVHHAADTIVVPSPSAAAAASRRAGVPARKIVIIPNAVDAAQFEGVGRCDAEELRRPPAVGFIGRLDPVKRIGDLLAAARLLRGAVQVHIFGAGGEEARLRRALEDPVLRDVVTMHGEVGRPQDALRLIDLLVLPSEAEGFGLVLIEAMAAGIPVVATDVPGIRDVVRHGETGLLVPPRRPAALAEAIRTVIGDSALRRRLRQAAAAEVRARYTWDVVLPQYMRLLRID